MSRNRRSCNGYSNYNNEYLHMQMFDGIEDKKYWNEYHKSLKRAMRDSSYDEDELFPKSEWS